MSSAQGTTSLASLPVAGQDGAVTLQATEKNVVVANMAAELAAKREQADFGQPTGGVVVGSQQQPPPAQPQSTPMGGIGGPTIPPPSAASGLPPQVAQGQTQQMALPSPEQQANYARGVADAAASGALSLPSRDIVGSTGEVIADPQARALHVPPPAQQGKDYIAAIEQAQRAKAIAAQKRRETIASGEAQVTDVAGDPVIQAAAIAGALFLITQLPATRAFVSNALPKLFTQAAGGGPTTGGATALAIAFGVAYYGASVAATYLGS